jgi:hypothetical protein
MHLLFQDRLAERQCGDRNRQDGNALQDRVQAREQRRRLEKLDPLPELYRCQCDQRCARQQEQHADDEMAGRKKAQ